jgi:hypothetical protein
MKKKFAIVSILGILLFVGGLARATVNSNSVVIDNMEYYVQTDKSTYNLGENVEILFRISNLSNEERRFVSLFPIWDIAVEQQQNRIWNRSWDKAHPDGPIHMTFAPNETKELSGIWPQIDLHGSVYIEDHTQVPPGSYTISGFFQPTQTSSAVNVIITPEPCSMILFSTGLLLYHRFKKKH